jgi:hypothetical protein
LAAAYERLSDSSRYQRFLGRQLKRARANRITRLTASALTENAAATALLRSFGVHITGHSYGVRELELSLTPDRASRQVLPVCQGCGLGPCLDAELAEDSGDVDARGLLGHVQRGPDLAVGGALRDQRQHLALAGG